MLVKVTVAVRNLLGAMSTTDTDQFRVAVQLLRQVHTPVNPPAADVFNALYPISGFAATGSAEDAEQDPKADYQYESRIREGAGPAARRFREENPNVEALNDCKSCSCLSFAFRDC